MPRYSRRARIKKRFALKRKKIAKERILILFSLIKKDPLSRYAPRYARLIFKISKKYRVPKPKSLIKKHCSACMRYLVLGKTVFIRIKNKKRVKICTCGKSF